MEKTRRWGALALSALLALSLAGCGGRETAPAAATAAPESAPASGYQYVPWDVGEQKTIEPAETFAGGSGTETDPYQISSAGELALLGRVYEILSETHDRSDERVAPYCRAHYVLTADIALNDSDGGDWATTPPEYAWTPIGFHSAFEGVFDGAGHTVSGLYIDADVKKEDASQGNCFGLFGENDGVIKNVNVAEAFIRVSGYTAYVGGIAGRSALADSAVENCSVSGEIICYDAGCGGIVGSNTGSVRDCAFSGSVECVREDTVAGDTGGIAGYNSGTIENCANGGSIESAAGNGGLGGIAGAHHGGEIRGCKNTGPVSGGQAAGGIAGTGFLSSIGGKFRDDRADIIDCENSADVTALGSNAGGIAGEIYLDYTDSAVTVSGCKNTGAVTAPEKAGGVIGLATVQGQGGVTVSDCSNSANISGNSAGGVAGSASAMFGDFTLTGCKNSGPIAGDLYGAGIAGECNIMTWDEDKAYPLNITVAGCENTGPVTASRGGGIAGVFISTVPAEYGGRVTVTLEDNVQNADIFCTGDNTFIGGIAGNVGVPGGTVTVKDCRASGTVTFPAAEPDPETTGIPAEELRLELSRIGGGMVGMVDTGLFLSTGGDGKDAGQVNAPDAKIVFTGCHSDMVFSAPAESEYVYDDDGTAVFLNRFGGVIGFCSDDPGLAFRVENCTYTGCGRGLGNDALPDVGTKQ